MRGQARRGRDDGGHGRHDHRRRARHQARASPREDYRRRPRGLDPRGPRRHQELQGGGHRLRLHPRRARSLARRRVDQVERPRLVPHGAQAHPRRGPALRRFVRSRSVGGAQGREVDEARPARRRPACRLDPELPQQVRDQHVDASKRLRRGRSRHGNDRRRALGDAQGRGGDGEHPRQRPRRGGEVQEPRHLAAPRRRRRGPRGHPHRERSAPPPRFG